MINHDIRTTILIYINRVAIEMTCMAIPKLEAVSGNARDSSK